MTYGDKEGQDTGKRPVNHEKRYEENGFSGVSSVISFFFSFRGEQINKHAIEGEILKP